MIKILKITHGRKLLDIEFRKYEFVIFPCMFSNSNQISFITIEITKETNAFCLKKIENA